MAGGEHAFGITPEGKIIHVKLRLQYDLYNLAVPCQSSQYLFVFLCVYYRA